MMTSRKCFFAYTLIFLFLTASCSKDDEIAVNDRDKFLGSYSVVDNGIVNPNSANSRTFILNYYASISINSNASNIEISNFFDIQDGGASASDIATAIIDGDNLTIPSQEVVGLTIEGKGKILNGVITIEWSAIESTDASWEGTAIYTPK